MVDQSLVTLQSRLEAAGVGEDPLGLSQLKEITDQIDPRKVNVGYAIRLLLLNGFECFFTKGGKTPLGRCWQPAIKP